MDQSGAATAQQAPIPLTCQRFTFSVDTAQYSVPKPLQSVKQQTMVSASIRLQNLNGQNFIGKGDVPFPQRAVIFPDTSASQGTGVTLTVGGIQLKFTFGYDHGHTDGDSIFMQCLGPHGKIGGQIDVLTVP